MRGAPPRRLDHAAHTRPLTLFGSRCECAGQQWHTNKCCSISTMSSNSVATLVLGSVDAVVALHFFKEACAMSPGATTCRRHASEICMSSKWPSLSTKAIILRLHINSHTITLPL